MFNRSQFNNTPFNRSLTIELVGNFNIDIINSIDFKCNLQISSGFKVLSELNCNFNGAIDKISLFVLEENLKLDFEKIIEISNGFEINTNLQLEFKGNRTLIKSIAFVGNFNPGQKIIIDMNNFTVTLDGQNALHLIEGDFFNLEPGVNDLIFTDTESTRQIKMQVEYRDRWL